MTASLSSDPHFVASRPTTTVGSRRGGRPGFRRIDEPRERSVEAAYAQSCRGTDLRRILSGVDPSHTSTTGHGCIREEVNLPVARSGTIHPLMSSTSLAGEPPGWPVNHPRAIRCGRVQASIGHRCVDPISGTHWPLSFQGIIRVPDPAREGDVISLPNRIPRRHEHRCQGGGREIAVVEQVVDQRVDPMKNSCRSHACAIPAVQTAPSRPLDFPSKPSVSRRPHAIYVVPTDFSCQGTLKIGVILTRPVLDFVNIRCCHVSTPSKGRSLDPSTSGGLPVEGRRSAR